MDLDHAKLRRAFAPAILLAFLGSGLAHGLPAARHRPPSVEPPIPSPPVTIDFAEYDRRMARLAHLDATATAQLAAATGTTALPPWPVRDAPYPELGAILPFKRIVAYYGNFLSTAMGVLGEYPPERMLEMLRKEVAAWEAADPETPVMPAIDYIAVVAQGGAGRDGKYRARMSDEQIDKAVALAAQVEGIVILEVQAGLADLQGEIVALEKYLSLPQVHLAIDPEFRMRYGQPPGTVVGTVDATDVNAAAEYLAGLVRAHDLPPKVLVVHRYTRPMVTDAEDIAPLPEVQIVMDMDGWGTPGSKHASWEAYIQSEPVQFTGFKLFYKNDRRYAGSRLLTPEEILGLMPSPSFIQYQ